MPTKQHDTSNYIKLQIIARGGETMHLSKPEKFVSNGELGTLLKSMVDDSIDIVQVLVAGEDADISELYKDRKVHNEVTIQEFNEATVGKPFLTDDGTLIGMSQMASCVLSLKGSTLLEHTRTVTHPDGRNSVYIEQPTMCTVDNTAAWDALLDAKLASSKSVPASAASQAIMLTVRKYATSPDNKKSVFLRVMSEARNIARDRHDNHKTYAAKSIKAGKQVNVLKKLMDKLHESECDEVVDSIITGGSLCLSKEVRADVLRKYGRLPRSEFKLDDDLIEHIIHSYMDNVTEAA